MSGELLLELLSEEIPARMQHRAVEDLTALVRDRLAAAEIPAASVAGFVTPRRLAIIADGIPATQPDRTEERRGPRVGAPEAAIGGFLRAAGLGAIDQCEVRETDRGAFYFAVLRQQGRPTADLLPGLLLAAIAALPWPKSMRFPAAELRWVRPLNSAICLFDGAVLPLALGAVPVGRVTRGHRVLSPGEISVTGAADYRAKLEKAHVVLDRDRRRQVIADGLAARAAAEGLSVKPDEGLLDEVTGLVEWPVVLTGNIDADFVRPLPDGLPPEVLATAMRTHQKYFSCHGADGTPAPRFLFVANNLTADGGKTIAAGNERVLRARLSDARFFWDQDRKVRLEDRVPALKDRVFHARLGSVYDKVQRVEKLAAFLADQLGGAPDSFPDAPVKAGVQGNRSDDPGSLGSRFRGNDELKELAQRAAHLCKADLSTGMVGEFPELQGIMGRYYALNDGEDPRVADAIADHYKPLGPNDTCPTAPTSVIVALADKIDTLYSFHAIDEPPTGSRDPFALRRTALGIIRIILENGHRLPLFRAFDVIAKALPPEYPDETGSTLLFVAERLKVHLREQGVRHDLISAGFFQIAADGAGADDDLCRLLTRVEELRKFLDTEDGANLLTAYRRASSIVAIEKRKGGWAAGDVQQCLLQESAEHALVAKLNLAATDVKLALGVEEFGVAMAALARLRQPVDEFFDKVTVNVEDKALRENRLRLLSRIRATMNLVADFSKIEG